MAEEIKLQLVKRAPPPPQLPMLGQVRPNDVAFFGRTNYVAALEEKRYIFGIKNADRFRHIYAIGKSGTGKSKLIELMARQDIAQGHGLCVMDQHGDLIGELLRFVPESRVADVAIIDPSDRTSPVLLNPLANIARPFRPQLAESLIEILEAQFGSSWNPWMEHAFRFGLLAIMDQPRPAFRGLIRMLTDAAFRREAAPAISDPMIRRFWEEEYEDWSKTEKVAGEAIAPLVNKLGQFLTDPILQNVLSEHENSFDLAAAIKDKRIVFVNLCKNKMGKDNASFFGALLIAKLKEVGMRRANLPERERPPFFVYIDEFHHLVTETFEHVLFESRKYRYAFMLTHQYLGQIIKHFQSSVFANVGTLIVFRVGGEDATRLESELAPIFKARDMINLGRREFYIKLSIDGEVYDPFSAETLTVKPPTDTDHSVRIIEASRRRYGHAALATERKHAPRPSEAADGPPADSRS